MAHLMTQLGQVQDKFKNAYAVILNCSDDRWNNLQLNMSSGLLRMLRFPSVENSGRSLMDIYVALKDSRKLKMQKVYFERENNNLLGAQTARSIMMESYLKLSIPEQDGQIIIDGYPNIKSIITASLESLSNNSPAGKLSIDKVSNFFGAEVQHNYHL
jgi:hypothetical protein